MKKLIATLLLVVAWATVCRAAIYQNYYTTNAAPIVGGQATNIFVGASGASTVTTNVAGSIYTVNINAGVLTNNDTRSVVFNASSTTISNEANNPKLTLATSSNTITLTDIADTLFISDSTAIQGDGLVTRTLTVSTNIVSSYGQFIGNGAGLTNIAGVGNANIATNAPSGTAIADTNYVNTAVLVASGSSDLSMNIGRTPAMFAKFQSGSPFRALYQTDGQYVSASFVPEIVRQLSTFGKRNGSLLGSSGTYLYPSGYGGFYSNSAANDPFWVGGTQIMTNGGFYTNLTSETFGPSTTMLWVGYWASNGLGTLTVSTQSFLAGTYGAKGTARVIDANNSSGTATFMWTNFPVASNSVIASLGYSGSSVPPIRVMPVVGQSDTNINAGFVFDVVTLGNFDWGFMMTNSGNSNVLYKVLQSYDLNMVADIGSAQVGAVPFETMRQSLPNSLDSVYMVPVVITNDAAVSSAALSNHLWIGKITGSVIIDGQRLTRGSTVAALGPLYTDETHLNSVGATIAGNLVGLGLGWTPENVYGLGVYPALINDTNLTFIANPFESPYGYASVGRYRSGMSSWYEYNSVTTFNPGTGGFVWNNAANNANLMHLNNSGVLTANASGVSNAVDLIAGSGVTIVTNGPRTYTLSAGAGSTTITNTTSAAGLVVGGSGSFGIGTNIPAGAGSFWVQDTTDANYYTNLNGDAWVLSGGTSIIFLGGEAAGKTVIANGTPSYLSDGVIVDERDATGTYSFGKVSVGTSVGQLVASSGSFSGNLSVTANGVSTIISSNKIYAAGVNLSDGSTDGLMTMGTSAGANKITLSGTAGNAGFAGTIYETNLTASRVILTDANKGHASAAASGAVPINADGSATTFAQIQTLAAGQILTNGTATALSFNGNSVTNVKLGSIVSVTNTYGSQSIDFGIPEATTNASGGITFAAALVGFNPTNYNYAVRHIRANGANRTITVPTGWSSTRTAHVVTNGGMATFTVTAQIGIFTNVSQVDYTAAP
jgi:hypothetical protein